MERGNGREEEEFEKEEGNVESQRDEKEEEEVGEEKKTKGDISTSLSLWHLYY